MYRRKRVIPFAIVLPAVVMLGATIATPLAAQGRSKASIQKSVDSVAASYLKDKKAAGMSIAVLRGADTLVMKGYGYADLELDVPTPPRAVYEIGSVTKQFTAASILMLRDQGKLDLDDEITKYLPTYPTQGHKITVRRLLDHTSGIKGYTELPKFGTIMTRHLPKDSLVALFSGEKFDFPTGDRMIYNNSAYFLAGMIIEKVSGMSYGDFVKKNLFDKAGMADSRYCSETAIIKRKAHGYDMGPNGLQNKGFVDHTYPFSAGSLCSTVGDLASWNRALHKGKILSAKSYTDITTPGVLNDGTKLRYTKGLAIHENHGHHVIEHGGGINGFLSASDYFDQDDLVVIVLVNSAGPVAPDAIVGDIADVILGKKALATQNFTGSLADLTGKFAGVSRGPQLVLTVTADKGKLVATTPMAPKPLNLQYIGNDTWDSDGQHVTFVREGGKVTKLRIDQVYGYYILDRQP